MAGARAVTPLRHPRSLLKASPADQWQDVITHYRRPFAERVADVLMAVILGLSGAVFIFHYLSR